MKKKGFTLVELLVVIAIIAMLLAILMPALGKVRALAYRLMCGTNLGGLGKAMAVYSNDYQELYPVMGSATCIWQQDASTNFVGGGFDGPQGWATDVTTLTGANQGTQYVTAATITSSLYLLVKYADVTTQQFVCKSSTQKKFDFSLANPSTKPNTIKDLTQVWDFGPCGMSKPWQFCSYSYQQPYAVVTGGTKYPLSASSQSGLAMLADRSPWFDDTGEDTLEEDATLGPYLLKQAEFNASDGSLKSKDKARLANSKAHNQDGQNVLYGDSHVAFETVPFTGIEEDNIYTPWVQSIPATGTLTYQKRGGARPTKGGSELTARSQSDADSFLAN